MTAAPAVTFWPLSSARAANTTLDTCCFPLEALTTEVSVQSAYVIAGFTSVLHLVWQTLTNMSHQKQDSLDETSRVSQPRL